MNNGTTIRELSSVGSERLPYKQRVGGSTPSAPTKNTAAHPLRCFFIFVATDDSFEDWAQRKIRGQRKISVDF